MGSAGRNLSKTVDIAPRKVLLPCYSLGHTRSRNFYGQDAILDLIDQVLLPPETPTVAQATCFPTAFALCGKGGLGKSEIALEYVHSRKAKFDAIFWINSATSQKLDHGIRDIAPKLGLQSEAQIVLDGPEAARDAVKAWLANPVREIGTDPPVQSDVSWLIVFDNANEPEMLFDFWPMHGPGSILVTSRNPLAKEANFAKLSGIDVPHMPADVAGHLLQKMSLRESEPASLETCSSIAERLGGLPLAVVQMAYCIRTKHLSLAEFIEYYDHDAQRLQETPVPGLTKQQTLASIWNTESLPAPAAALLRVLSVLDGDVLYEDILTTGSTSVEFEDYLRERVAYFEAREALARSSLVTRNINLGFLTVHRLVRDVVRQKMSPAELRAAYDAAVTLMSAVWPFVDATDPNKADRLRKVQQYFPHIGTLRSVLKERSIHVLQPHIKLAALFNEATWSAPCP